MSPQDFFGKRSFELNSAEESVGETQESNKFKFRLDSDRNSGYADILGQNDEGPDSPNRQWASKLMPIEQETLRKEKGITKITSVRQTKIKSRAK